MHFTLIAAIEIACFFAPIKVGLASFNEMIRIFKLEMIQLIILIPLQSIHFLKIVPFFVKINCSVFCVKADDDIWNDTCNLDKSEFNASFIRKIFTISMFNKKHFMIVRLLKKQVLSFNRWWHALWESCVSLFKRSAKFMAWFVRNFGLICFFVSNQIEQVLHVWFY